MTNVTCELVWVRDLLTKLGFAPECHMKLYCDNHIAENSVFHEHTKHIKVDYHLVHHNIEEKIVQTRHVLFGHQLADLLTMFLGKTRVDFICDKLRMNDVYTIA